MSLAYRGLEYAAERAFSVVADTERLASGRLAYERRVARTWAGLVGMTGGVLMFASALWELPHRLGALPSSVMLTVLLLGSGASSVVTYGVARIFARLRLRWVLARKLRRSGDAVADLAYLEENDPARVLSRLVAKLEYRSVVFPLLAMSLLLPLTLHWAVALMMREASDYDEWIRASAFIVGHAHVVLCICCVRYARVIRRSDTAALAASSTRDWSRALAFTTFTAAVPGLMLLAVPPVLTVLTGLVFIPAMYRTIRKHVVEERSLVHFDRGCRQ